MKIYRYRKHILWMKYLLPGILLLLTIGSAAAMIANARGAFGIGIGVGVTVFPLSAAWVIWWVFSKLARVEVGLTEDGIDYHGQKAHIKIPFEEITEINQPSIRYTGGWIKIRSATNTIRLTVVLEGISEFVRELKESLDRLQMSDKYDREKLFRFYKTAAYSDHSWARVYELFFKLVLLVLAGAAVGVVIALLQERERMKDLFLVLAPAAFVVVVAAGYVIAEVIIGRHFAKATNEEAFSVPGRDRAFESKVFKRTMIISSVLAALVVLAFCA